MPGRAEGNARNLQTDDPVASLTQDFVRISLDSAATSQLQNDTRTWTDSNGERFVSITNPVNQVQTSLKLGPAERITDPTLFQQGIRATQMVLQTQGDTERLFDEYKRREQPRRFFKPGKVFRVLWAEPAGDNRTSVTFDAPGITTGRFGEPVHSKVRLFVVIREGDTYCSALPILSYNGQGVAKRGVNKSEHSIVYTGKIPPQPSTDEAPRRGEEGMRPDPIRVNPDDRADPLNSRARIDYGKVYTIHHNIKVKPYGQVHPDSQAALRHQFLNVWLGNTAEGTVARSSSDTPAPKRQETASAIEFQNLRQSHPSTRAATNPISRGNASSGDARLVKQDQMEAAIQIMMRRGVSREEAVRVAQETASRRSGGSSDLGDEDDDSDSDSEGSHARSSARGSSSLPLRGVALPSPVMRQSEMPRAARRGATSRDSNSSRSRDPQTHCGASDRRSMVPSSRSEAGRQANSQQPETSSTRPPHEVRARTEALLQQLMTRGYTREQAIQYARASLTRAGGV